MRKRSTQIENHVSTDRKALALAIKAALPFASDDETRPHLSGVSIGVRNGRLMVCATDGHRAALIQAKGEDAAIFGFYGGREGVEANRFGGYDAIVLPARKLAAAFKGHGKDVEACFWPHQGAAGVLRIGVTLSSGDWEDLATVSAVKGVAYPPIFQVCTALDPRDNRTQIAPGYLEAAGALGRAIGAKGIEITVSDPLAPVVLSMESESFRAAIWQMPMRLDDGSPASGRDRRIAQIIDPGPARTTAAAE